MPQVNPEKVKFLLKKRKDENGKPWTYAKLAKESGVGDATIKRVLKGKVAPNKNTCDRIALALSVPPEELNTPPDREQAQKEYLRKLKMLPFHGALETQTFWNFDTVTQHYGLSMKSQLALAPLAIALLAEGSLAARREKLKKIENDTTALATQANGHLSFAGLTLRIENGIEGERASIERRDFFGEQISEEAFEAGYDPVVNNPFADYLEIFARDVCLSNVSFNANHNGIRDDGLPDYRLGNFAEVAGESPRAEMAIDHGYVRRKDIPQGLSKAEQVAWIEAKLPQEEWVRHQQLLDDLENMGLEEILAGLDIKEKTHD
jgi:transcriptional regulator with XRE-family HTH domain